MMLTPPTHGFAPSVTVHRVQIDSLAEWIEACVTFDQDKVSKTEIVDILIEENIYRNQDFARQRVTDAFNELSRRVRCLADVSPYAVTNLHVKRNKAWDDTPAYSFCLMLATQVAYRANFTKHFGSDYTEQGILFERLTAESLGKVGWKIHATGWSKKAARSIRDKIEELAHHLGEPSNAKAIGRWTNDNAKDGGLDIVCHVPFVDGWAGRPLYFVQCASGEGWMDKRSSPNLSLWNKLVDMATWPRRGLAIPFALLSDDFRKAANYDHLALFMDRHRVCAPIPGLAASWTSNTLSEAMNNWTTSRLTALLAAKAT